MNGLKLAVAGFLIPYVFVLAPEMLFASGTIWDSLYVFAVTFVGVVLLSMSVEGYMIQKMPNWQRILCAGSALLLIHPNKITDFIGFVMLIFIFLLQKFGSKKAKTT